MVRGGWFASSTVDHLVEREHADAEYTRDCNYRLISFSMLLHVLLFVFRFFFARHFSRVLFFFFSFYSHFSIITEVSYVGTFLRFYTYICVHHLSLSADRGTFFFARSLVVIVLDGERLLVKKNFECEYIFLFDAFHLRGKREYLWRSLNFDALSEGASDDE